MKLKFLSLLFASLTTMGFSQTVEIGSASYTTRHPGYDTAGRNHIPSGTPQMIAEAALRPVPTNDWWSKLIKEDHATNLFTYPFTLKTTSSGLVVSHIPRGVIDDLLPLTVGLPSLNASKVNVSDFSDWSVTMNWTTGDHQLEATAGIAMPFIYFTKKSSEPILVNITSGNVTIDGEMLLVKDCKYGADFALYAPTGSNWENNGNSYTSTLNGKDYMSLAFIPMNVDDLEQTARQMQTYAYAFPTDTRAEYNYNENTGVVRTNFIVDTEAKEGTNTKTLMGLLPHQWSNLSIDSNRPNDWTYQSIRGQIQTVAGNEFSVDNTYYGILPTLPPITSQSPTFDNATLQNMISAMKDDQIGEWTDSYNDGQLLNRLVQTARIAAEIGNNDAFDTLFSTVKRRTENWLSYSQGEVAFLFYYNADWTAMIGYPAGHGQDSNLNDHHFHWGYFIHAASFIEQYEPGWAAKWGDMVNLLVRDAASFDREDEMFPYLRNFSPYAGHCWANGFATFPQGNDQESTSESMQFNSSLIHWGTITNNKEIRDLGIYLYTTEQSAINEYWFDTNDRNFPNGMNYCLVSRVWGNDLDNGTFWTSDIAASYGIELYPIHGGSLYLAHNEKYLETLWSEIKQNTGILQNQVNPNLWHDIMWQLAAFTDPDEALRLQASYPDRDLKFGVSDAQTYYWLHSMKSIGKVTTDIRSSHPISAAFDRNGRITYVAQNYSASPLTVRFSDGYELVVKPYELGFAQEGELQPDVVLTSPEAGEAFTPGANVTITATAVDYTDSNIVEVAFYVDGEIIDIDTSAPYETNWNAIDGKHTIQAVASNKNNVAGESEEVEIFVSEESVCTYTSDEALQGSFSTGYEATFQTVGDRVDVTFKMLDTDKVGLVAYIWQEQPFSEQMMQGGPDQIFKGSIVGKKQGDPLRLACKFAYAGGMSVTKYFDYVVGSMCGPNSVEDNFDDNNRFYVNNQELIVEVSNPSEVKIFNLSSNLLFSQFTASNIKVALPKGIYILMINGSSYKVAI